MGGKAHQKHKIIFIIIFFFKEIEPAYKCYWSSKEGSAGCYLFKRLSLNILCSELLGGCSKWEKWLENKIKIGFLKWEREEKIPCERRAKENSML